jgi:multidrug efflux pump subunit AcrA (membrane-fusion protein)
LIAPYQSVAIQSDLTEPADAVNVQEGDRVTKGEVLARLDTADLEANLAADLATAASDAASATHTVYQGGLTISQSQQSVSAARAAVRQAQETLRKDSLDLARYQQLLANGFISQQQVATQLALVANDGQAVRGAEATLASDAEQVAANGTLAGNGLQASSVQQARATQAVALATAQQVRTQIAKATIVSPIDGVVVNRNLNPGEYPGTRQLFTLQQVDPIYAIVRGSGAQVADLERGASATVIASDLGGARLRGTVSGVLSQINPGSTDFQVKIALANPGGRLRAGMAVVASVALPPARGIRIPETAFIDDNHDSILIVDGRDMVETAKVTETISDGKTSLVRGIPSGTRVVTDGQSSVGDGQKVAIR